MGIVQKLPTDLLYIIVQYLPNRNREKSRLKYLYDRYIYNSMGLFSYHFKDEPTIHKLERNINEYTRDYITNFYKKGNKIEIIKDLPFVISCKKCKKVYYHDDFYMNQIFKNELSLFKGYIHTKYYHH